MPAQTPAQTPQVNDKPCAATEEIADAQAALAAAERDLHIAHARADCGNWSASTGNRYETAVATVQAAHQRVQRAQRLAQGDEARKPGVGVRAWAILALMIAGASYAALTLYLTTLLH